MNPRVENAVYLGEHKLKIIFRNGECKIFDFTNYLDYPVYKPLESDQYASQLHVQNGTVCWGNQLDFDPDTLYLESIPQPQATAI
jgi:hypothetical protein